MLLLHGEKADTRVEFGEEQLQRCFLWFSGRVERYLLQRYCSKVIITFVNFEEQETLCTLVLFPFWN